MQVQVPSEHNAFGPQGDGLHGSTFIGSWAAFGKLQLTETISHNLMTIQLTWWWFWETTCKRISSITL